VSAPTLTEPTRLDRPAGARRRQPSGLLARSMARLGSWRVWLPLAAGYAVFAGLFFGSSVPFAIPQVEATCGAPPPDMRFGGRAADVHAFLVGCGPAGRQAYHSLQLADLAYPLVFAAFLASSLALVLRHLAPGRPRLLALAAIPFVASGFDYLENVCAWSALAAFPSPAVTDGLLGMASVAKTTTSWVAGALLIAGAVALAARSAWRLPARRRGSV
jgi:hypothetical protein